MKYISVREASEKWKISPRRVQVLCNRGRIVGVERLGNAWAIPVDAVKPRDGRYKDIIPNTEERRTNYDS